MMNLPTDRRTLLKSAGGLALASAAGSLPRPALAAPTKVTVMSFGPAEAWHQRWEACKKNFPGIESKLELEVVDAGPVDTAAYQALRLALASGSGIPDLVQLNYSGLPEFAEGGALADLGAFFKGYASDLTSAASQVATYRERYFAIPYQLKPKVWFYRRDLFAASQIDPATIRTPADYLEAGKRFHADHPKSYFMNLGKTPIYWWYFMLLSNWDDVVVADREGNYRIKSDPRFGAVFDWTKTWATSDIAFGAADFTPDFEPGFAHGAIAGTLTAGWMMPLLPTFAPDQAGRWGMSVWPQFNRKGSEAGAGVVAIPRRSTEKSAAFELASKLFLNVKGALSETRLTGSAPVIQSAKTPLLSQIASDTKPKGMSVAEWNLTPRGFFGKDYMTPTFAALDEFNVFKYDPSAQAELNLISRECDAYIAGVKSLEQLLNDLQAAMESQIGNPYKT